MEYGNLRICMNRQDLSMTLYIFNVSYLLKIDNVRINTTRK